MIGFIKKNTIAGNIFYVLIPLAVLGTGAFASYNRGLFHEEASQKIEVSYGGNMDYKEGDIVERPLSEKFFSLLCFSSPRKECVVTSKNADQEMIMRFPYVEREWKLNNKTILYSYEELFKLPSVNNNPSWSCADKESCKLVMEEAKRIGW